MKLVFNKIPKLAIGFYVAGFSLIILSLLLFYGFNAILGNLHLQQLFIAGGLLVAVGSVVNTCHQFKTK